MFEILGIDEIKSFEKKQLFRVGYIPKRYLKQFGYGFVYLIVSNKKAKIGISSDIESRIKAISRNLVDDNINKILISTLCSNCSEIEKSFKCNFSNNKISGEWFSLEWLSDYISFLKNQEYESNFITQEDYALKEKNNHEEMGNLLKNLLGIK